MNLLGPQLEAFMAVVKNKTVHGAANEIFLTQAAVTQRIRTLERALRTTLFVRTRRGMKLTSEGEALLRYCHAAKNLEGETLSYIQGAGIESEIEISITGQTSIMRARIIPCCISVMRKFPKVFFSFEVNDAENRYQLLKAGKCDFAILNKEDLTQEMKYKVLTSEQYVLVCSAKWKNRKTKDIVQKEHVIDYDSSDQMTFNYLKKYNLFKVAQHKRYFANRTEDLALLVTEGIGYTALAMEFAKPYIDKKQLIVLNQGKKFDVFPVLAWYDRPEPPKYFSAIIKAIN